MPTYAVIRILGYMSIRRRRRPYSGPKSIQSKIPSRFEHVTPERIERNRRGRALCEAMIRSHRATKSSTEGDP